jgi:hypothetical protein
VVRGLCVLALVVGSVVVATTGAAEPSRILVLKGGATVEVADAQLRGDMVVVTRLDGRRVPVRSDRLDLRASGLVLAAPDSRLASGGGLVDLASAGVGRASARAITDADVDHVEDDGNDDAVAGGSVPGGGQAGLRVSGVRHVMSGARAMVSGTVTNTTGVVVNDLVIEATALAEDRSQLGHASTTLGPLGPGAASRFSVPLDVLADPAAIRVFVNAPVDQVLFDVD